MTLFNEPHSTEKNLLPYDGEVIYHGPIFDARITDNYYQTLLTQLDWKADEAIIFGKHIFTKRKVAWYGDFPYQYTYSGIQKTALSWHPALLQIKTVVEDISNEVYNSCLCNLYHNGSEGMAWHSDGEKDLKKHGVIASVTLGSERKFGFKHKDTKETLYLMLEHGSLLLMKGTTQDHWLHRLPPTTKVLQPRINLTFRKIEK